MLCSSFSIDMGMVLALKVRWRHKRVMTMLRTQLTEQYGLEMPFVSAGMGFVAMPELVAAVSNAGGLGLLGVAPAPPPAMQAMIQAIKQLTPRPFGVDLIITDTAFGPATTTEHIEICSEEGIKVAVFFWNQPPVAWVDQLHAAGVKVWMQVGSVEGALEAVQIGADAIIAQGSEAGGHNHSRVALFSLVPAIVDAVAPVLVIAAGGIADGRTAAAALTLGAEGVCVGIHLVASREGYAHEEYKRRIVVATAADSVRTSIFGPEWPDQPMRVIRNRVVSEWAGQDERTPPPPDSPQFIGRTVVGGQEYPMPKFAAILPTPDTSGDFEEMCLAAGESAGLVKEVKPAAEIVREIMNGAERVILERLASMAGG
jgi:NAD(P)H-dependent flavin oxidoreductase YrpB (nitropropane dioxygenase family)